MKFRKIADTERVYLKDKMKNSRKFLCILLLAVAMLPFQNCGVISPHQSDLLSYFKSQGNGGGYDGKPDGTYYLYIPNHLCAGAPAATEITEIKNGQASLLENKTDQCGTQSTPISLSDLNISPFENDFISVKDVLFKRYAIKPQGNPSQIAEVLCRDDFEKPTYEIVSHFDRETNQASARIYGDQINVPDFATSRVLSSDYVQYVADQLSLTVDISRVVSGARQFKGQIRSSTLKGINKGASLTCVTGGSLDTSHWVFHPLSDLETNNVSAFFGAKVFFHVTIAPFISHIFVLDSNDVQSDFTQTYFGDNFSNPAHYQIEDSQVFVVEGRPTSDLYNSHYVYDHVKDRVIKMTNRQAVHANPVYLQNEPILTQNRHLIYGANERDPVDFNRSTYSFNDLDLNSTDLYQIPVQSGQYQVLPSTNRVLFFETSLTASFFNVYDIPSKSLQKIATAPDCPVKPFTVSQTSNLLVVNKEQEFISMSNCGASQDSSLFAISIKDGSRISLGQNRGVLWSSQDQKWLWLTDLTWQKNATDGLLYRSIGFKNPVLYNSETHQFMNMTQELQPRFADFANDNFYQDNWPVLMTAVSDQWIYGFGGDSNAPHLYQVSLKDGTTQNICENAVGKKIFFGVLPNQKLYLLTHDSILGIYRFYLASSAACTRINEFPSTHAFVPSLKAADLGFALALNDGNLQPNREALFVPMDGRPPLRLNYNEGGYWNIFLSLDKKRVLLGGPNAQGNFRISAFDLSN